MRDLLFVYGTLRLGCPNAMALRLASEARHLGSAQAPGRLYAVGRYPAFIPGRQGMVVGDVFALTDPSTFAWLDAYEGCGADDPAPQEYRRERLWVNGADGMLRAWVYVYAWAIDGLPEIAGGDFLACAPPGDG